MVKDTMTPQNLFHILSTIFVEGMIVSKFFIYLETMQCLLFLHQTGSAYLISTLLIHPIHLYFYTPYQKFLS